MTIRILKKKSPAKHVVTYLREGFPDYWMFADDFLVLHDLSHFAIEKTLQYESAFWGLVKQGINPEVFENKAQRDQLSLSNEAWYAEHLANLFLMELSQGPFENIQEVLASTIGQTHPQLPLPTYSDEMIETIRVYYKKWVEAWRALPPNESLAIHF
jgi:hypothetical protein